MTTVGCDRAEGAEPSVAQMEAMLRVVGKCHAAGVAAQPRLEALLGALIQELNLKVALAGLMRVEPGRYPPELFDVVQVGEMTDSEQRVVEEYFADLTAEPDPAHVAAVARMNGAAIHLRRQDLVDDDQWLASAHVRNCRHRVGVNECLYSAIPCSEPGKYFGISLHRPWSGVRSLHPSVKRWACCTEV